MHEMSGCLDKKSKLHLFFQNHPNIHACAQGQLLIAAFYYLLTHRVTEKPLPVNFTEAVFR